MNPNPVVRSLLVSALLGCSVLGNAHAIGQTAPLPDPAVGNAIAAKPYRAAIFATSAEQASTAAAYIKHLDAAKVFGKPIVTKVDTLERFFPAEIYHQGYVTRNMNDPYVVENDLPKIAQFRSTFPQLVRR